MKTIEMECLSPRGLKIRGFLYLPDKPVEDTPCVIISHGFTSSAESNIHTALAFVANDIAALTFDFGGGSPTSASQGKFEDVSVQTEVQDLQSVLDWVKKNYKFKDIFLFGSSMGGFVSAIEAAKNPEEIKGLMLIFPAFVIPDDARKILNQEDISDESPAVRAKLKKEVLLAHASLDFEKAISGYPGPVLIIHGDQDRIAPLSYSRKALKIYKQAELIVYPGQGHGFDWKHKISCDDQCVEFVKKYS